ncbi:hypothetical protein N7504_007859 [Penicillium tannophilum]|nr:hypothetical protein N7504_007859 [Penicillium tannophilum]
MRPTLSPFIGLVLFFGLSQALSPTEMTPYESVCDSSTSEKQLVEDGLFVTYECGRGLYGVDYNHRKRNAATPRECAIMCSQRSSEGPCTWENGVCYEYNEGRGSGAKTGSIVINTEKTNPNPEPDCRSVEEECQKKIETKDEEIEAKVREIGDKVKEIGEKDKEIEAKVKEIGAKDKEIEAKVKEIGEKVKEIGEKNKEISSIKERHKATEAILKTLNMDNMKLCPTNILQNPRPTANDLCYFTYGGKTFRYYQKKTNGIGKWNRHAQYKGYEQCAKYCAGQANCEKFSLQNNECLISVSGGGLFADKPSGLDSFHRLN